MRITCGLEDDRYLYREEAIGALYGLINSGILEKELENTLEELTIILESELDGIHLWGRKYSDCDLIHTAMRSDLITDDVKKKIENQYHSVKFTPCNAEQDELIDYFNERYYKYDENNKNKDKDQQLIEGFEKYYGVIYHNK